MQILLVEDDAMNRRVVRDMLSVAGVDMIEAHDGPTGLSMVQSEAVDLVLMDLRMPGMDGLTAIRHIRARDDDKRDLPIIVITADQSSSLHSDCLSGGADAVLLKPVAMQELFDTIGRVVARHAGGGALPL